MRKTPRQRPSTGESSTSVPVARTRATHFTKQEKKVVRWAISSLLAGEIEDKPGDIEALESALRKLGG